MEAHWVEAAGIAFCRIGCCLMVAAAFASARIPISVRLFVALSITLAVLPVLEPDIRMALGKGPFGFARLAVGESLVGVALGLVSRLFLAAFEFATSLVMTLCGLAMAPTPGIDSGEASSALGDLVSLTALAVVFASGVHLESLKALLDSYSVVPAGAPLDHSITLGGLVRTLAAAFQVALQFAAPFILLSVLANLMLGLATRMIPQVPMQFVAGPVLAVAGIALLGLLLPTVMLRMATTMSAAISR